MRGRSRRTKRWRGNNLTKPRSKEEGPEEKKKDYNGSDKWSEDVHDNESSTRKKTSKLKAMSEQWKKEHRIRLKN